MTNKRKGRPDDWHIEKYIHTLYIHAYIHTYREKERKKDILTSSKTKIGP